MSAFLDFIENIKNHGLEYFGLYYGTYAGTVVSNDDPENRGRLQIECPEVWGADAGIKEWIMPRGIYAGKEIGFHAIPEEKDTIWVTFRGGKSDPKFAMWEYGWWIKDGAIKAAKKGVYVFSTPKGHSWLIDENNDTMYFQFKDGKAVEITKDKVKLGKLGGTQEKSTLGETTKKKMEEICDRIGDVCDKITALTVPTALGPSGTPINAPAFVAIKTQVSTLKSQLGDILSEVMTNE